MIFRTVYNYEYNFIAELHLQSFPDFFLSSLGKEFLETYYKSCLKDPDCIAFAAMDEYGELKGFILGTKLSKGFHKRVLVQNLYDFISSLIIICIKHPKSILRLLKNLSKNSREEKFNNYSELLSIGVSPDYMRLGIGKRLLKLFENAVLASGNSRIFLTTDSENNDKVVSFYERAGYIIQYKFETFPKRVMYKMSKEILYKSK